MNNSLEYYINKVIKLNKNMSIVYIWLILIVLSFSLSIVGYACHDLSINLEDYIKVHNSIIKK